MFAPGVGVNVGCCVVDVAFIFAGEGKMRVFVTVGIFVGVIVKDGVLDTHPTRISANKQRVIILLTI